MNKTGKQAKIAALPVVTIGLVALNVVYFILIVLGGNPSDPFYMISRGADYSPYVFEEHQFWRLVTSMFMHFSLRHLAGNMIYLAIIGWSFEKVTGHLKFFLIYFLAGLGGNIVSCGYHQITHTPVVSAGASGAVYGIIALVAYLTFISRKRFNSGNLFLRIGIMLVFLFYSNFINGQGTDVAAHIGGLFFGGMLSFVLLPYKTKKSSKN